MLGKFHAGELAVQEKAGVVKMASQVGNSIRQFIPAVAQDFLKERNFLVATSLDNAGQVWASVLTAPVGFIEILDDETVLIQQSWRSSDPLVKNLADNPALGLLALDMSHRRRMRLNGQAFLQNDGTILLRTTEVYANCPKYIQVRDLAETESGILPATLEATEVRDSILSQAQQNFIAGSDTFFIGSYAPERGADASHRGGMPGFVQVVDGSHLVWPDYAGNKMFNTLGNLQAYNRAGLLFIDFEAGKSLQLTGVATLDWDEEKIARFNKAERLVEFAVSEVIEAQLPYPFRWEFKSYSPFNPTNPQNL